MAAFDDCIRSAQKQGVLSEDEAEALIGRYDEHRRARAAAGDTDAEGAAKTALAGEFETEAARKRLLAGLAEQKHGEIRSYLESYRNRKGEPDAFEAAVNLMENFGSGAGHSAVKGRSLAITGLAHSELADLLRTFRRSAVLGRRHNAPLADDVVREILQQPSGKPEAQGMAQAVSRVFEGLRERFNAAGGDIGKLDGGYLPQAHNPRALLNAGFDTWRDRILPRLDLDRMKDPLTDGPLTPDRLNEALRVSYDRITTGGWSDRKPEARPFGLGALANRRADPRFLHFKTADDWLAYDREFGHGDPIKAIFNHINGMARDIASMEVLGPNPRATLEWLKQVVSSEVAKASTGKPSLYSGLGKSVSVEDTQRYLGWRLDAIHDYVRGREVVSGQIATGFGNVRNLLTSAQLSGTSVLAAMVDPFIDMGTRYLSGLPVTKALGVIAKTFSTGTREEAVRAGIILDDFLHILADEARYAGTLGGSEITRWMADRTVTLNGLQPMTQARRHVLALDFMAAMADNAAGGFDAMPPYLRRTMEDYGITAKDWDKIRKTALHTPDGGAGFLRPVDIAVKHRDLATKVLEMIYGQTERSVPTGTARARSFVTGTAPRGTVAGELLESGLQYKSFALSFTTLQLQAVQRELHQGVAQGAAYAGSMAVALTLGGAMAMQLRSLAAGKDVQPMDATSSQGIKFWFQAMQTGGGMGLMGDFLFADVNRFGHSLGEQLAGPTVGLISDAFKLTTGNVMQAVRGEKTNIGREAINFAGRNTPILPFYTRAAYRRMFLDQLQYLVDPEAHKYFREQEQRMRRETGQGYFWRPGESLPERAPEMSEARK